jgi:hypothetical protein
LTRWERTPRCLPSTLGHRKARESLLVCASQPGSSYHRAFEHERRRDGTIAQRGGRDHFRSLRSLRGTSFGAHAAQGSGGSDGQPLCLQRREDQRDDLEQRGCQLVYLPSYSPDLNPIEEAFSKIKGLVRKVEARTKEALVESIGWALSTVTSEDARGLFEHCGYRMSVQSLW